MQATTTNETTAPPDTMPNVAWYQQPWVTQLGVTLGIIVVAIALNWLKRRAVGRVVTRLKADKVHATYISKLLGLVILVGSLLALGIIWGIELAGVWVILSTLFTLLGIGLFAVWSLLSNLTSAVVLYFSGPFRLGNRIRIAEGDGFEGVVEDMTLFHVRLIDDSGAVHFVPNNVVLQRTITVLNGVRPPSTSGSRPAAAPAGGGAIATEAATD